MHLMGTPKDSLKIKVQIYCGDEIAMGPGKADLLDAIMMHGSISAAGRAMGMSYRRTWLLVDVMNRCWDMPLVETVMGGKRGGGARLTARGQKILADYRALQTNVVSVARGAPLASIMMGMRDEPKGIQSE